MSSPDRSLFLRRRLPWLAVVALAFAAGLLLRGPDTESPGDAATEAATVWTCAMHPQIQLPEPGQCPICFMDLIPVGGGVDDGDPRSLALSETAVALAEIVTAPVERGFAARRLRLVGRVVAEESRTRTITARYRGRIDTLFVADTGTLVRSGQKLASVYSPELYAAQVELRSALGAARQGDSAAAANLAAARQRLGGWGLTSDQIADLESAPAPREHLTLTAPAGGVVLSRDVQEGDYVATGTRLFVVADLARVRVELEAYESDLPWLRAGQTADFQVAALPGREFRGEVVFIDPVLDARTRTAGVRLTVDNPDGRLRPGFFVRASVSAVLDADGRPVGAEGGAEPPLIVPATAPLITGARSLVYVRDPDSATPRFLGREVVLGPRAGDHYLVVSGLSEGERVVVNGAFKIDSALQIQARPSMMSPPTAAPAIEEAAPAAATAGPFATPAGFRAGLGSLLAGYYELQAALASDDATAARDAARAALAALGAVPTAALDEAALAAWSVDQHHLTGALKAMGEARDIAALRAPLAPLSDRLWAALNRYGYAEQMPVRRFHCPMAGEGGANWLQAGAETANPYYGAAMPGCGSQTDLLAGGGPAAEGP